MKISDIKAYPVWVGHRNLCLVKVETDEGIYGWGESGLSSRELAVAGAVKHFREFLLGRDARNIGALWQEMYRSQYFEGGRVLTAAISAIDIALWDIAGKALNVPTYQLLGGKQRDVIPLFVTSTKPMGSALLDDIRALADQGWEVIRATTGEHGSAVQPTTFDVRRSIAATSGSLREIRQELGEATVLGIDYHHRLSVAEAASFCQKLGEGVLDFIEEPIRDQSPSAYQGLRRMVDVPFAIGEEFASKWDFMPYIEQDITNFARIDVCNVGGLTEAMKVAAMAESHYIDIMPHDPLGPICTAATIQMCAAVPNLSWCEIAPYDSDTSDHDKFFINRPKEVNRAYPVGDAPGLGIDVNEALIAEQSFKYWEAPRLYKPDGSYTNW
ncbi:mandelate racemase/muconate lactonizing enzyme family protein [Microbulbifer thermotolerans]|uniref:Galactonate dehydratase n=1 Tax=Microbulbifer thermotolerans TaxID=252514 RepID=A0A143HN61_MICTH|nr:mandelate racemase/muconate lactonizing enzyme family protein [Microbulbifer thermotolerans]AMX02880.1 galactonate dehydratase [Microbulbifer thermotolerans]MCX2780495.1 mandelate racemase/muconate lactonizing enzyme family protein [Microbulbifer thermotolerans]MCX2784094.1 mandelate racemase/muconate lactonizing enzyme family protein [Microbulbifer thermotolerans]MCX2794863.1 mandelate racemase/muconate lactonizing enzyme family protein [Microbulbifer thermotolerans]MCX2803055.1 mandelate 